MIENYKFYEGYRGEPEYVFCVVKNGDTVGKTSVWGGYFGDIIDTVEPLENKWTSLAEYRQLCIDFEEPYWKVPDLNQALSQLLQIDRSKLHFDESFEVLDLLIMLFRKAVEENSDIYIEYN